jgi:hypothetical protein
MEVIVVNRRFHRFMQIYSFVICENLGNLWMI